MKNLEKLDTTNLLPKDWNNIYQSNGYEGQGSGPGSTLQNTHSLIDWLTKFILNNKIFNILDIGCGDLQWMPSLLQNTPGVDYTGLDCAEVLLQKHRMIYPNYNFINSDVYDENFKIEDNYDLVFCKDVVHHRINDIGILIENLNNIKTNIQIIVCPEYMAIEIAKSFPLYTWVHTYMADEPKGISIRVK
jgi:2-polyprenyl-3-methyl-5-hydroxy-6-metoxy-1,4-benzoquinol methylase